ncbi:MAG: hypothetical protein OEZ22_09085 [Spirochaetia bacterium]|nr:hypothetical protein [Spirochaetia bacterium]
MKKFIKLNAEELKKTVCDILDKLNIKYKTEVNSAVGSSIIGKGRRVDVVLYDNKGSVVMHIECKSQNVPGTAEDKLFKAVVESNRDKSLGIPSIIVFSGFGWNSADVRHALLNGSVRIEMFEEWINFYLKYQKMRPEILDTEIIDLGLFASENMPE